MDLYLGPKLLKIWANFYVVIYPWSCHYCRLYNGYQKAVIENKEGSFSNKTDGKPRWEVSFESYRVFHPGNGTDYFF